MRTPVPTSAAAKPTPEDDYTLTKLIMNSPDTSTTMDRSDEPNYTGRTDRR
ncbi:hypothetical protein C497_17737 [Halalkalicoccus jeotgali B3]|uniref:Uncharacterized protein n=1 Tax=Halalkalicoccus jeotgali (strain DSM 18796 / CECT 7217 / JCM 14584 / KCTC 4019 / B3) TaxID=795797 RepID=D8J5Q4_HALJB|nr:hypothetical protein HacjB3_01585 [Halalkalicoccus jeotgali B3]ELY34243.1 hypothetical protein C497_17737 [Halalkalicoccus jeotgali B3]